MNNIKFFYNGLKVGNGKLQKAHYSFQAPWYDNSKTYKPAEITIYGKHYVDFSKEVAEIFEIQNNTDMMTDYFEQDRIRVSPMNIMFKQVAEAYVKQEQKRIARATKRGEQEYVRNSERQLNEFIKNYL